jgi:hypothetical protein
MRISLELDGGDNVNWRSMGSTDDLENDSENNEDKDGCSQTSSDNEGVIYPSKMETRVALEKILRA